MSIKGIYLLALIGIMSVLPALAIAKEVPKLDLKLKAEKEVVLKDTEGKSRTEWREVKKLRTGRPTQAEPSPIQMRPKTSRNVAC